MTRAEENGLEPHAEAFLSAQRKLIQGYADLPDGKLRRKNRETSPARRTPLKVLQETVKDPELASGLETMG